MEKKGTLNANWKGNVNVPHSIMLSKYANKVWMALIQSIVSYQISELISVEKGGTGV